MINTLIIMINTLIITKKQNKSPNIHPCIYCIYVFVLFHKYKCDINKKVLEKKPDWICNVAALIELFDEVFIRLVKVSPFHTRWPLFIAATLRVKLDPRFFSKSVNNMADCLLVNNMWLSESWTQSWRTLEGSVRPSSPQTDGATSAEQLLIVCLWQNLSAEIFITHYCGSSVCGAFARSRRRLTTSCRLDSPR